MQIVVQNKGAGHFEVQQGARKLEAGSVDAVFRAVGRLVMENAILKSQHEGITIRHEEPVNITYHGEGNRDLENWRNV